MRHPKRFLCSWWKDGKWAKTIRFGKLSVVRKFLLRSKETKHIYLYVGSVPADATTGEIDMFLNDISKMLKEKFDLLQETIVSEKDTI